MELGVEGDLVRWTESFVSDRKDLNGQEGGNHEVETGILQGSPVSPILFTVYLSGLFGYVEERVPSVKALSFVDDVAWATEGDTEDDISQTLEQVRQRLRSGLRRMRSPLTRRRRKRSSEADGGSARLQRPHPEASR